MTDENKETVEPDTSETEKSGEDSEEKPKE